MALFSGRSAGEFGRRGGIINMTWIPDPDEVAQKLLRLEGELMDAMQPLRLAAERIRFDVRERFMTETDPRGFKWKPWSGEHGGTKFIGQSDEERPHVGYAQRARRQGNPGILRRPVGFMRPDGSEQMFSALMDRSVYEVHPEGVNMNMSRVPRRWLWHMEGREYTTIASDGFEGSDNDMPARPMIGPSLGAQDDIVEYFDLWFRKEIDVFFNPAVGGFIGRGRNPLGQFVSMGAI